MSHPIKLCLALILSVAVISKADGSDSRGSKAMLKTEVDSILQSQVNLGKIPGAVILIKESNKILCRRAFGYAMKFNYDHELASPPEKMTVSHMFDIASLTKVIGTTTSVMLLADRGQLNIDDPAGKYIEAFNSPDKKEITLRHLITHTAGLYEWYPLYYLASAKEECYRVIGELPLKFPVGEGRHYSDLGFVILGEIIEEVSGMSLEEFMRTDIFLPLRMNNTTFNPLSSGRHRKIVATSAGNPYEKRMVYDSTLGYQVEEIDPLQWNGWRTYLLRGEVNDGNAWYANGGVSGAAGLFSTAADLQKIVDMLLNKGMTRSGQFLSPETVTTFLTMDKFNNGLGWMMDPGNSFMRNAPDGSFGHTGFTGTSIAVIPSENISVILLVNRQNIGLSDEGDYYNLNPIRSQVFRAVLRYVSAGD